MGVFIESAIPNFAPTKAINELIVQRLLPAFPGILHDESPIPGFALKLLSNIAERNAALLPSFQRLGILSIILGFVVPGGELSNAHVMKLLFMSLHVGDALSLPNIWTKAS